MKQLGKSVEIETLPQDLVKREGKTKDVGREEVTPQRT